MEKRLVMANTPRLLNYLQKELSYEFSDGLVEFHKVRSLVSSPRLFDVYVRDAPTELLAVVGGTYLDQHTMLADRCQKTYAASFDEWESIKCRMQIVSEFASSDDKISNIQIWPYPPSSLDNEQFRIAVALSFTRAEFLFESRLSGALNELLGAYGFFVDEPYY